MKLFFTYLFALLLASLTFVGIAEAGSDTCNPVYGAGTTCATTGLLVDKKVKHPEQNVFIDNLNVNDPKYLGNQDITFRITVKNTGSTELKTITVTDTLPTYLKDIKSSGSAEIKANSVTHKIETLKPNETKTIEVSAKIADPKDLPTNQGTTCVVNKVVAHTGNVVGEDTSAYCIQVVTNVTNVPTTKGGVPVNPETPTQTVVPGTTKGGLPVYPEATTKNTPNTGPETLALVGLLPSGLLGYLLRRKTK